jgi:beta-N-acetylhexosaminidase
MTSGKPVQRSISAAQLLVVGFRPQEEARILSRVADGSLGGVILFSRNGEEALQVARLCGLLRDAAERGGPDSLPIVAVDQEQGRICRIKQGITLFPGASVLGGLDRPRTTERVARWVARELSALGVNLNLAPVADVATRDPVPPVLAGRIFGGVPSQVARHVRAWINGSQEAALAACAKHFPGHGAAKEDSHLLLPRDSTPLPLLQSMHLRPFRSAISAGVASIMVGHMAYEALDPETPASLSPTVLQGLLRNELGFRGLVLTDDLEMEAVADRADPVSAAIQAIRAGADMVIVGRQLKGDVDIEDLVAELHKALQRGLLPRERVAASYQKVLAFKRAWVPARWAPPSRPPTIPAAQRLADRLTLEGSGS